MHVVIEFSIELKKGDRGQVAKKWDKNGDEKFYYGEEENNLEGEFHKTRRRDSLKEEEHDILLLALHALCMRRREPR